MRTTKLVATNQSDRINMDAKEAVINGCQVDGGSSGIKLGLNVKEQDKGNEKVRRKK